ncbi:hypothetical protein D3C85_1453830 [compost metagenome]
MVPAWVCAFCCTVTLASMSPSSLLKGSVAVSVKMMVSLPLASWNSAATSRWYTSLTRLSRVAMAPRPASTVPP